MVRCEAWVMPDHPATPAVSVAPVPEPFHRAVPGRPAVRGFLHRPASPARDGLVLTHGAGGNSSAKLLVAVGRRVCGSGALGAALRSALSPGPTQGATVSIRCRTGPRGVAPGRDRAPEWAPGAGVPRRPVLRRAPGEPARRRGAGAGRRPPPPVLSPPSARPRQGVAHRPFPGAPCADACSPTARRIRSDRSRRSRRRGR